MFSLLSSIQVIIANIQPLIISLTYIENPELQMNHLDIIFFLHAMV